LFNVLYTTFIKRAGFALTCIVPTIFTLAILNTPMLEFVIYTFTAPTFVVTHGAFGVIHKITPPKFMVELAEIKKGQIIKNPVL